RATGHGADQCFGSLPALGQVCLAVGGAQVLGASPCPVDLLVAFVGLDRGGDAVDLPVGEVVGPGAQDGLDAEQRVALAAPVAGGLLLHAAADLIDALGPQRNHVEGVQH